MQTWNLPVDALGAGDRDSARANPTPGTQAHRRIAHCECGAPLAGDSEQELLAAAERHVARHHPQVLGALGPEVLAQMAETVE